MVAPGGGGSVAASVEVLAVDTGPPGGTAVGGLADRGAAVFLDATPSVE
jgi:hypothetical protein